MVETQKKSVFRGPNTTSLVGFRRLALGQVTRVSLESCLHRTNDQLGLLLGGRTSIEAIACLWLVRGVPAITTFITLGRRRPL
jgi:hypothetical protein